jgi:tRNA(Ile2) C34 agmatinyltransferase TiaS
MSTLSPATLKLISRASTKHLYKNSMSDTPKCPYCGGTDVIDNGDSWYCYPCNARFGSH